MIPNRYHFVFGLRPQTEPFHIAHYLCLRSCLAVNRPERLDFYYHHEPHGPWWDRIRDRITPKRIEPVEFVRDHPSYFEHDEGRFIKGWSLDYAHQTDFIRLELLLEHGGVYADIDTLFVAPLPATRFAAPFVIGEEDLVASPSGAAPERLLCNAFLMSAPGAAFAERWLERMYGVFDGTWNRHSCDEAARIAAAMPDEVEVVPKRHHYKHPCTRTGIEMLLRGLDVDLDEVYSMHLWAHLWWSPLRTDFTTFHARMLTEDYIRTVDTTYNVVARRFLDP